jgi:AhpD family alkylhydroperoxidase
MQARINNPVLSIPGALDGIREFAMSAHTTDLPAETIALIELRVSQINSCSVCADMHSRELELLGCSSERMHTLAAGRAAPYFRDAAPAALALAEAATRLADNPESVSDEIWDEAARHYSEQQLSGLVVTIAAINAFNRLNATTRQPTGPWVAQFVEQAMAAKA